jgi:hypothetical protein
MADNSFASGDFSFRADTSSATSGGSDGTNKQWLPIWSGEVMYAYDQFRMFDSLVDSRTIASGRVMEFPIMGTVDLKAAWGAGEELIGNTNDHQSKTVSVELDARPIATHFELDNVDLMITQWEYRQELARQAGQTMANARDLQISAYLTRAAAESILASDPRSGNGWRGNLIDSPIYDTTFGADFAKLDDASSSRTDAALQVLAAVEDFMVHLQSVDCPTDGVTLVVTPRTFHDIRALGVARAGSELSGGSGRPMFGGVAEAGGLGAQLGQGLNGLGDTLEYMGCTIVKSNHLINFDASADAIGEGRYNIDGSTAAVKGLLFQKGAVASIAKTGLKVDTVDDIRRNTTFTVASMLSGTGVLRPELASIIVGSEQASKSALRSSLSMGNAEFVNVS